MTKQKFDISAGRPQPLGATVTDTGCNFAVHSPNADKIELCFFHPDTEEPIGSIEMPAKTGKVWHCHIEGIETGQLYGYRTYGKSLPEMGLIFDPQKLLIDPYAKRINRPIVWNRRQYSGDSQFMVPKSVVVANTDTISWHRADRLNTPLQETILYEAHVKGLTQLHPDVDPLHRGKFLGVCAEPVIQHLKSLGVTAIQLLPVMAFMPEPYITEKGLTNYWGYNTINYFCPDPRYAR